MYYIGTYSLSFMYNWRQIQNCKGSDDKLITDFKNKLQETFKQCRHNTPNTWKKGALFSQCQWAYTWNRGLNQRKYNEMDNCQFGEFQHIAEHFQRALKSKLGRSQTKFMSF